MVHKKRKVFKGIPIEPEKIIDIPQPKQNENEKKPNKKKGKK